MSALSTVVLVEGASDRRALEVLAARRNRDLDSEGISIVAMGGATNIGSSLDRFGPKGSDLRLAGLCDVSEEGDFKRALENAGFGSNLTRSDMEALGFFVCVQDLEDELIRALGVAAVEAVVESQRELRSFRTLQRQPGHQGRSVQAQLRRFMGTRGGRKLQYAAALTEALDPTQMPRPLVALIDHL